MTTIAQKLPVRSALKGNIVDYLLEYSAAPQREARPYLVAPDRTWTYRDLRERVARVSGLLKTLGVKRGERVLFSVVDGIDFPALFLGIMKHGAVALPINTYLKPQDYKYFISDSGARLVIVDHSLTGVLDSVCGELPNLRQIVTAGAAVEGYPFLDALLAAESVQVESAGVGLDEMAFWLYSSGSTGMPKGVVHTGNHIFWATELFGLGALRIREDDIVLSPPKMYFAFGLGNQVYFPIRAGALVVVNPAPITPSAVLEQWLSHPPTVMFGVPTLFAGVLRLVEESGQLERFREATSKLRLCVSGGEILPPALMARWRDATGTNILDGVGTTEMTHMFLINRPDDPVAGSCGRLVEGYSAEIVDDDDKPVDVGEIGNLRMFGPSAAREYWNKPERTATVMAKGGVLTGDKVYRDHQGNYFLVGRADDMLRVGGIWVSPAEVENVIAQHPAVMECAVVGHPDQDNMIKPKAYVVARTGDTGALPGELRDFVRERLAHIKCPRWFEIVAELPKTSTGKIQRFRLRQAAQ
jgi:benzoate-CoA ligase family protein